jgi:DNA-binding transcriptional regulator GbsR (MarR family)
VNAVESDEQTPPHADVMQFVEQMGGYFESNGLTRLAGRLLGWLLVCEPERQSSEELAVALDASSGGISTNARMLIQFGFIERLAIAGDRRTFFRLRPNAFAAGERHRLQTMADLQQMAEVGLNALRGSGEERCRRLYEMRDLLSYMEKALTEALHQYRQPAIDGRGQEPGLID